MEVKTMRIPESYERPFADYGRYRSLRITADKREIKDFPKLPSATSFILDTLYEIWLSGLAKKFKN